MMLDSKPTSTHAEGFYVGMIGGVVQNQIYLQRKYGFHGTETSYTALLHYNSCIITTLA